MHDAAFIINLFDLGGEQRWRSWGSTATVWCRSRATKQILHIASPIGRGCDSMTFVISPSSVSEPAHELSGLGRKWRPQTFADVVGREHVLTALANGLSLGRIHHAYLFPVPAGSGKTSIARLLAKGLTRNRHHRHPCGVCDNRRK